VLLRHAAAAAVPHQPTEATVESRPPLLSNSFREQLPIFPFYDDSTDYGATGREEREVARSVGDLGKSEKEAFSIPTNP
jgi:hypothetical protein